MAEYLLNTADFLQTFNNFKTDASRFIEKFSINGFSPANRVVQVISYGDFNDLRTIINAAAANRATNTYFTGLRLYYGIKFNNSTSTYEFILIYVPVIMDKRGSVAGTPIKDIFSVTPASIEYATKIYEYNGNFIEIGLATAIEYIKNYRNMIRILRANGTTESFFSEDTIYGDAKASLLTFQEIDLIANTSPNPFYFVHQAHIYPPTNSYKHYIAISKIDPETIAEPAGNVAVAANFANLCPPNCPVVEIVEGKPIALALVAM